MSNEKPHQKRDTIQCHVVYCSTHIMFSDKRKIIIIISVNYLYSNLSFNYCTMLLNIEGIKKHGKYSLTAL